MFEASESGPRSIEDRVLRERTDSDVGGPRRSTHPESSVVGETPATRPPARGGSGSRRALLRRAATEESEVAEAPGRLEP